MAADEATRRRWAALGWVWADDTESTTEKGLGMLLRLRADHVRGCRGCKENELFHLLSAREFAFQIRRMNKDLARRKESDGTEGSTEPGQ